MKKPKSALANKFRYITKLREKRELRTALSNIWETQDGKIFFKYFLRHCHVTKTVFDSDPYKIVEKESLRRLAMSYLTVLAKDNPDFILEQLEAELNRQT